MFITAAKKTNLGDKIRIAFSSRPGLESHNEAAKVANNLKVGFGSRTLTVQSTIFPSLESQQATFSSWPHLKQNISGFLATGLNCHFIGCDD